MRALLLLVLAAGALACASSPRRGAELDAIVAAHDDRNAQLLSVLADHGVDLDAPRTIELIFYAPTEGCADQIEAELVGQGFSSSTEGPTPDFPQWETLGVARTSPNQITNRALTERFVRTATACGGEFDGWGTQLDQGSDG